MKKRFSEEKGFTLAELLIVVAIIAVLVAIAIPVFTTQLERAREATDIANIRSSYAEAMTEFITTGKEASVSKYSAKQTQDGWQTEDLDWSWLGENAGEVSAKTSGNWTVTINPPSGDAKDPTVSVN